MKAALLAMHYQNDVLHPDGLVRVGVAADDPKRTMLIDAATRLIAGARANGVAVISVRIAFAPGYADCLTNCTLFRNVVKSGAVQDGQWGADFFATLAPLSGEAIVTHQRDNPFWATDLEAVVQRTGATRLYMAGIATNYVVEHGARHASDLGYDVAVVGDACSTAKAHLHAASLETLSLLADIVTVDEAVAQMSSQMSAQIAAPRGRTTASSKANWRSSQARRRASAPPSHAPSSMPAHPSWRLISTRPAAVHCMRRSARAAASCMATSAPMRCSMR